MRVVFSGPEGDQLLGFLAAVGTLNTLDKAWPERVVRLGWEFRQGAWRVFVDATGLGDGQAVVQALAHSFQGTASSAEFTAIGKDLPVSASCYREKAHEFRSQYTGDRRLLDFLAAFGHDAVQGNDNISDTAFRTMSGAGHQHFLGFMKELAAQTTPEHLAKTLFESWQYDDPRPSLRWDPTDDRRYALRSFDPGDSTRSPILTVRGANRLAVEALPTFPVAPRAGRDRTRGFARIGGDITFSWPIWEQPLGRDAVRTLVGHPSLMEAKPSRHVLQPLGVVEVFRCRRINVDRYRNFTPSVPCWGTSCAR